MEGIRTGKELKEVTSKRFYSKAVNLDELYRAVCRHYQIREIVKGWEGGRSRNMFVYVKRQTTALNSEIGEKAGRDYIFCSCSQIFKDNEENGAG